jgi:hypothetical protein
MQTLYEEGWMRLAKNSHVSSAKLEMTLPIVFHGRARSAVICITEFVLIIHIMSLN